MVEITGSLSPMPALEGKLEVTATLDGTLQPMAALTGELTTIEQVTDPYYEVSNEYGTTITIGG